MDWWLVTNIPLGKDSHQSVYSCIYIILCPCTNQYISCSLNRDCNRVPNCILFMVWSRWLAFVLFRSKRLVHAFTLWLGHTLSSHSLVPTGRHAPGFCLRVLVLLHVGRSKWKPDGRQVDATTWTLYPTFWVMGSNHHGRIIVPLWLC